MEKEASHNRCGEGGLLRWGTKKDEELLKLIQAYFGGIGRIGKERNGCCDPAQLRSTQFQLCATKLGGYM